MAATLRKRKIIDTGFGDVVGISQHRQQRQPNIQHFGRLGKPGVRRVDKATTATKTCTVTESPAPSTEPKKRKLQHATPTKIERVQRPVTPPPSFLRSSSQNVQRKARLPPSQPGEPRRIAPLKKGATRSATVAESPTQGARAILEAFVIAAPASATPFERIQDAAIAETTESKEEAGSQNLIALHTAFLNALSLHFAHEGTSTPADLRQLATSITRIWGRRRVTAEDIQRVLGIQQWNALDRADLPVLTISDFGKGRVCIEYEPAGTAISHSSPLPVATLKRLFANNLLALGHSALPLAPITLFVSNSIPSTTTTGATRLADLKASALNAQASVARSVGLGIKADTASSSSSTSPLSTHASLNNVISRGASLLERICAKEAHAATQPAAPTAAAIARKAALQRLEEIIPVIELLASRNGGSSTGSVTDAKGGGRSAASMDLAASLGLAPRSETKTVSFTMSTLVQHLQNSLRHPLSSQEGELCISILAKDILPRWVQLHNLNKWTSVSVRGTVRRGEWMEKIHKALQEGQ